MSTGIDVIRYCRRCQISLPAIVCPRCGDSMARVSACERRRPRHAPEDTYLPAEYHISEDLRRTGRIYRQTQIGYTEE